MFHLTNYSKCIFIYFCLYLSLLVSTAVATSGTNSNNLLSNFTCSSFDILLSLSGKSQQHCDDFEEYKDQEELLTVKGDPMRIMYNRVPKTGSTTVRTVMYEHADFLKYKMFLINKHAAFLASKERRQEIVDRLFGTDQPTLYERHVYFIDFQKLGKPQPVYINLIRDPVARSISNYYFARARCRAQSACFINEMYINETLDECVKIRPISECLSKEHGVAAYLEFFCGQDPQCNENKTYALEMAKNNVIKYYTVVGILEELYNFFFVLESLCPRFFTNIRLTYMSHGTARQLNSYSDRENYVSTSKETMAKMRVALSAEYEFYDFIKKRFHVQYQGILKRKMNQ